jgi:hypothetical protein
LLSRKQFYSFYTLQSNFQTSNHKFQRPNRDFDTISFLPFGEIKSLNHLTLSFKFQIPNPKKLNIKKTSRFKLHTSSIQHRASIIKQIPNRDFDTISFLPFGEIKSLNHLTLSFKFQIPNSKFQIPNSKFQIPKNQIPNHKKANHKSQITKIKYQKNFPLQTSHFQHPKPSIHHQTNSKSGFRYYFLSAFRRNQITQSPYFIFKISKNQIPNLKKLHTSHFQHPTTSHFILPASNTEHPSSNKFQIEISILFPFCLSTKSNHSITLLYLSNFKFQISKNQISNHKKANHKSQKLNIKKTSRFKLHTSNIQHRASIIKQIPNLKSQIPKKLPTSYFKLQTPFTQHPTTSHFQHPTTSNTLLLNFLFLYRIKMNKSLIHGFMQNIRMILPIKIRKT